MRLRTTSSGRAARSGGSVVVSPRPPTGGAALARCLQPADPDDFLRDVWEQRPLHVAREDPRRYDDLLTREEAERLVTSTGIRTPSFRLVRAGEPVGSYAQDIPWRPQPLTGTADVRRVLDEWRRGATIVLQALHITHSPLAAFARALEHELRHPVQVNAYYTPREAQGLPVHHDTHDVFVLQVSGSKRWLVYEPALELPLRTQRYTAALGEPGPTVMDVTLHAGDTLYLPRGWLHEALTSSDDSLHLTVGVNVITWLDAARAALEEAAADVRVRRSIDAGGSDELLEALADRLERADVERRREERLVRRTRPLLADGFEQLRRLDDLSPETPLLLNPVHARLDRADGRLRLQVDGGEFDLPGHVEAEVTAILSAEEPFTAAELPGSLDEPGRLVLVRRLVREGVLRQL